MTKGTLPQEYYYDERGRYPLFSPWDLMDARASRARAYRATAQSIPDSTSTIVQFNTESFDNLGEWDITNYHFTPQKTGYYHVDASCLFDSAVWTANQRIELGLYRDGGSVSFLDYHRIEAAITSYMGTHGSDLVYIEANHYIDIRIWHDQGAPVNLLASSGLNYVAIHRLS